MYAMRLRRSKIKYNDCLPNKGAPWQTLKPGDKLRPMAALL